MKSGGVSCDYIYSNWWSFSQKYFSRALQKGKAEERAGELGGQEAGKQITEGQKQGGEVAGKVRKKFLKDRKSVTSRP